MSSTILFFKDVECLFCFVLFWGVVVVVVVAAVLFILAVVVRTNRAHFMLFICYSNRAMG